MKNLTEKKSKEERIDKIAEIITHIIMIIAAIYLGVETLITALHEVHPLFILSLAFFVIAFYVFMRLIHFLKK